MPSLAPASRRRGPICWKASEDRWRPCAHELVPRVTAVFGFLGGVDHASPWSTPPRGPAITCREPASGCLGPPGEDLDRLGAVGPGPRFASDQSASSTRVKTASAILVAFLAPCLASVAPRARPPASAPCCRQRGLLVTPPERRPDRAAKNPGGVFQRCRHSCSQIEFRAALQSSSAHWSLGRRRTQSPESFGSVPSVRKFPSWCTRAAPR